MAAGELRATITDRNELPSERDPDVTNILQKEVLL